MPTEVIEHVHMLAGEGGNAGLQICNGYNHDNDDDNDRYYPEPDEEEEDLVYDIKDEPIDVEELAGGEDMPQQIAEGQPAVADARDDQGEHQPYVVEDDADVAKDESSQEDPMDEADVARDESSLEDAMDIGHISQGEEASGKEDTAVSEPKSNCSVASKPKSNLSDDTKSEEASDPIQDSSRQGEEDAGGTPLAIHMPLETRARLRLPDESQGWFAAAADALAVEMDRQYGE